MRGRLDSRESRRRARVSSRFCLPSGGWVSSPSSENVTSESRTDGISATCDEISAARAVKVSGRSVPSRPGRSTPVSGGDGGGDGCDDGCSDGSGEVLSTASAETRAEAIKAWGSSLPAMRRAALRTVCWYAVSATSVLAGVRAAASPPLGTADPWPICSPCVGVSPQETVSICSSWSEGAAAQMTWLAPLGTLRLGTLRRLPFRRRCLRSLRPATIASTKRSSRRSRQTANARPAALSVASA